MRIAGTLSQWISGLLLLAPFATGPTVVEVDGELNEQPYVELTVQMMRDFGLRGRGRRRLAPLRDRAGGQEARPTEVTLPPDIGSAAFGLAATALHPSDVVFRGLPQTPGAEIDHPEAHFLDVVAEMGLPMELDGGRRASGCATTGSRCAAVEVDCRPMPDMLPVLATMASFAEGETRFSTTSSTSG